MFTKSKKTNQINYLNLTPIRLFDFEIENDNRVTLLIPKFTNIILQKYILPKLKSPYIKIKLDKLGSSTWLKCDGNKTVNQICNELLNEFGEEISPVEERVTKFLSQLYNYQSINFKELNERN